MADDHSRPTVAIPPMQIPNIPRMGDHVEYHFRGPHGLMTSRPAVITSVDEKRKEVVNLFVFFEPGDQRGGLFAANVPPHDDGAYQPHTWSRRGELPTTSRVFG